MAACPHVWVQGLKLVAELAASPELQLSVDLEPGDIQVVHNWTQLHRRDNYEDHEVRAGRPQAANCHVAHGMNRMPPYALTLQGFENRRHLLRFWLEPENGRPLDHSGERTGSSAGRHTPSAASPLVKPPCGADPWVTDHPTADLALPQSLARSWMASTQVSGSCDRRVVGDSWPLPASLHWPLPASLHKRTALAEAPALALYCTCPPPQALSTVLPSVFYCVCREGQGCGSPGG